VMFQGLPKACPTDCTLQPCHLYALGKAYKAHQTAFSATSDSPISCDMTGHHRWRGWPDAGRCDDVRRGGGLRRQAGARSCPGAEAARLLRRTPRGGAPQARGGARRCGLRGCPAAWGPHRHALQLAIRRACTPGCSWRECPHTPKMPVSNIHGGIEGSYRRQLTVKVQDASTAAMEPSNGSVAGLHAAHSVVIIIRDVRRGVRAD